MTHRWSFRMKRIEEHIRDTRSVASEQDDRESDSEPLRQNFAH